MIKAVFFDINGTLIDILTNEGNDTFRVTANYLRMLGVTLRQEEIRKLYFELNRAQRAASPEEYPEFDARKIFSDILEKHSSKELSEKQCRQLGETVSGVFRSASLYQLELYPGVRQVLDELKEKYILAAVTDGQSQGARSEICMTGLDKYFESVIISGDQGFRKPDLRMFTPALDRLNLKPEEVIFVGNDIFRDISGAKNAGLKAILFKSNQGDHKLDGVVPDCTINSFDELPAAIAQIENSTVSAQS